MLKIFAIAHNDTDCHKAARMLLKWKYEELWQSTCPSVVLEPGGKPTFRDTSARFSIAHTAGASFVALCDSEVGLDVERTRIVSAAVAQRVLSRDEWERYSASADPHLEFLKLWTLKQAYAKCLGLGCSIDPKSVAFDFSGDRPCLPEHPELQFWCRGVGDFVIAACADHWHRPEVYLDDLGA